MRKLFEKLLEITSGGREILLATTSLFAILFIFFGFFEFREIKNPDTWMLRSQPIILLVAIGLIITTANVGIAFSTRERQKKSLPNISGNWHYFVTDAGNKPSHTGNCQITINNSEVRFSGIRRFVVEERGGKRGSVEKNWPWETTWTDYGTDGWFRCEYTFKSFNGYFKVQFPDSKSELNEFNGTYYLLPDSFEAGQQPPNAMYGTIKFRRVSINEYDDVKPPVGLKVWQQ